MAVVPGPTNPHAGHGSRRPPEAARAFACGFTLLEILLALGIAALAAAVAAPNLTPLLVRAQLYSATRDVASALRYARGQAIVRGQETSFELDIERHRYRVSERRKPYSLSDQILLSLYTARSETVNEGVGRIRFYPDGSSTGGRVTLEGGGRKKEVDVNWLTGEVRVREDEDGEG